MSSPHKMHSGGLCFVISHRRFCGCKALVHQTMEMSPGYFVGAFVLFILMLSTTQAFPRNKEGSSNRNNSTDESDSKELQCFFVDNKLPICGSRRWSNSNGNPANDTTKTVFESLVDKISVPQKKDIVEITADTRIVVHAFKDCLLMEPDRLRFLMPFCEDVIQLHDFDRIVRVELFEPFVIEDLIEPPYIFPDRPKRSKANRRRRIPIGKDQDRANDPAKPSKETTPIVAGTTESSSNTLVPRSRTKPAETMDTDGQIIVASSSEWKSSPASATAEYTICKTGVQDRCKAESRGGRPRGFDRKFFDSLDRRWKMIVVDRRRRILQEVKSPPASPAIPTTPSPSNLPTLTGEFVLRSSANELASRGDSNDFFESVAQGEENIDGIAREPNEPLALPEVIAKKPKRKRKTEVTGH
nr:uncharacterized protein LOC117228507 isoform X2 [Megalopta genalis]